MAELRACGETYRLGPRPWLMGVVNANPDSFSDAGRFSGLDAQVARAADLLAAGADVIDIGGESGITGRPETAVDDEIARVVPLITRVVDELGALVSVDTYKPAVAAAAIEAGARIVNDVSGLRDLELASICASTGAALVVMHTRAAPKTRLQDPAYYDDVVADVRSFLAERVEAAVAGGVDPGQLVLDPGPDFAKTPAQTVAVLRRLDVLHELGRPLLLAISRKDFIGAITGRPPAQRDAGTLAALAFGADAGAAMFRVHDVRAAADFLAVRSVLRGDAAIDADAALADDLRHEPRATS
jgi:dihydropteroate synthase